MEDGGLEKSYQAVVKSHFGSLLYVYPELA